MSSDLARLESASALRTWEDDRSKNFASWRDAARALLSGLRSTIELGVAHHHQLDRFLRRRSAADKAYAQALAEAAPPASIAIGQPHVKQSHGTTGSKKDAGPLCNNDIASAAAAVAEAAAAVVSSPLLASVAELQRAVSQAREAFSTGMLEGTLLKGLASTLAEFEKTGSALLHGLEADLAATEDSHEIASREMSVYRRVSIQGRPSILGNDVQSDAWLQEHRYRKAIAKFHEKQRGFTAKLCVNTEEIWRLEEWREEMARKVVSRYCTKLHEVETEVQSLSNDGIRALAGHKADSAGERAVLRTLEKVLQSVSSLEPLPLAKGVRVQWPALCRLRGLSRMGAPPNSALARAGGVLQAPRRWYGSSSCVSVLTKDDWIHCFHLTDKREQRSASVGVRAPAAVASKASPSSGSRGRSVSPASGSRPGRGEDCPSSDYVFVVPEPEKDTDSGDNPHALDAVLIERAEVEPQWSMYVPNTTVSGVVGKPKCFELEEVRRKSFLGLRSSHREQLQADSENDVLKWIHALKDAAAVGARPPPPPQQAVAATAASSSTDSVRGLAQSSVAPPAPLTVDTLTSGCPSTPAPQSSAPAGMPTPTPAADISTTTAVVVPDCAETTAASTARDDVAVCATPVTQQSPAPRPPPPPLPSPAVPSSTTAPTTVVVVEETPSAVQAGTVAVAEDAEPLSVPGCPAASGNQLEALGHSVPSSPAALLSRPAPAQVSSAEPSHSIAFPTSVAVVETVESVIVSPTAHSPSSASAATRSCSQCGTTTPGHGKFCCDCGTRLL